MERWNDGKIRSGSGTTPTNEMTKQKKVGQTFLSATRNPELKISRRRLPHWTLEDSTYFITFKTLADLLSSEERAIVSQHIKQGAEKFYYLIAATVMPDHVHLILKPLGSYTLSRIMKGIKGVSSRKINQFRGSRANVWQDEFYDRIIRDQAELEEKLNYMFYNPVKKGLCDDPQDWDSWYCSVF